MKRINPSIPRLSSLAALAFFFLPVQGQDALEPKRIHVIVALCDNTHQGIAQVNPRIGNGDDPENNLYWGCSDGLSRYFRKASEWKLMKSEKEITPNGFSDSFDRAPILEQLTFKHGRTGALLIAEAWRGREIKAATKRYFDLLAAPQNDGPDLVAWIGHNSLMDFALDETWVRLSPCPRDTLVLACKSHSWFGPHFRQTGVRPVLMTDQLMYPGSFLLKHALEGWLLGEPVEKLRERAARAYATSQKISFRSALGVFSDLKKAANP